MHIITAHIRQGFMFYGANNYNFQIYLKCTITAICFYNYVIQSKINYTVIIINSKLHLQLNPTLVDRSTVAVIRERVSQFVF